MAFSRVIFISIYSQLKHIILLETIDVEVVRDRSHWFKVQMKELGYNEGINMALIVLIAKENSQLAKSLLKDALEKRKLDLVVSNATLASKAGDWGGTARTGKRKYHFQ